MTATVPSPIPLERKRRFTVAEYHQVATLLFTPTERTELIEGEIVNMSPISPAHAEAVRRLNKYLAARLAERAVVDVQNPITLGNRSEPQPDVVVLKPRSYHRAHPTPADVLLVVEVSDSTLSYDREVKAPLYARAGITEMWLVDVANKQVEVYRQPKPKGYLEHTTLQIGETLHSLAFPDVSFTVSELLDF